MTEHSGSATESETPTPPVLSVEDVLHQSWDNVLDAELARTRVQKLIEEAQAIQKANRRRTRVTLAVAAFALIVASTNLVTRFL